MGLPKNSGIHGLLTPELIERYAAQGMTPTEISHFYGCHPTNIIHAVNDHPEKKAAWERGNAALIERTTSALMTKIDKGDIIAILFTLKVKAGWIEAEKLLNRPDETMRPVVNVYLPHNGRDSNLITDQSTPDMGF